jgi:hypothetical protein
MRHWPRSIAIFFALFGLFSGKRQRFSPYYNGFLHAYLFFYVLHLQLLS